MNTQLKKIGLGLMLMVTPLMAASASAQWTQQGVTANFNDAAAQVSVLDANQDKSFYNVSVDQNGTLAGQVASIDAQTKASTGLQGLSVFFVRDGQVIKQAKTQEDGTFQMQDVQEGAYSFFVAGQSGFAAYGIYVSKNAAAQPNILEATLASTEYSSLQQVLQNYIPKQVSQELSTVSPTAGTPVSVTKEIRLINGRLQGQITQLFGQTEEVYIHLIQDDQPIAQVQANELGQFAIPDVEPGIYDFIAASKSGLVVGRIEAVTVSQMSQISYRKMATQLEFAMAQTQDMTIPETQVRSVTQDMVMEPGYSQSANGSIEYAGESIGYGGASGASSGNAGNFSNFSGNGVVSGRFGGGRFRGRSGAGMGRLLMLGGFAGGIIAIADDDPNASSNSNN